MVDKQQPHWKDTLPGVYNHLLSVYCIMYYHIYFVFMANKKYIIDTISCFTCLFGKLPSYTCIPVSFPWTIGLQLWYPGYHFDGIPFFFFPWRKTFIFTNQKLPYNRAFLCSCLITLRIIQWSLLLARCPARSTGLPASLFYISRTMTWFCWTDLYASRTMIDFCYMFLLRLA